MNAASPPAASLARIRKRSVVIQGHATSVSLEEAFWRALKAIAADRGLSVNALITNIDRRRTEHLSGGASGNLSSAIRVFVLENKAASGNLRRGLTGHPR